MNDRDKLLLEEIMEIKRRRREEAADIYSLYDDFKSMRPVEAVEQEIITPLFPRSRASTITKLDIDFTESNKRASAPLAYNVEQKNIYKIMSGVPFKPLQSTTDEPTTFPPITLPESSSQSIEKKKIRLSFISGSLPEDQEKKLRFDAEEPFQDWGVQSAPPALTMRFEYAHCPTGCERFMDVENFAKLFVDELTEEAIFKGKGFQQRSGIRFVEGIEYTESSMSFSDTISTYVCLFEWPTISDFTIDIGMAKIEEYISYWKFSDDWKHCVDFLHGESDSACDFYRYEAIFGMPCKMYPIAQATASVYFTFEVSRIRPKHCFADMYYWFEGQRQRHTPGHFTFQEDRLFNIVDAKIKFFKTLTF